MTPREKAEDLLAKMNVIHYRKLKSVNKDSKGLPVSMYDSQIKQCALIAVDEIFTTLYDLKFGNPLVEELDYWEDVKKEIENLKTK
jgi:hypothetical protein